MAAKTRKKATSKASAKAKKTTTTVKSTAKKTANTYTKATHKGMETFMLNGNPQFDKFAQQAAAAGQDQMEALVRSGTIFAKGMENIMKTCMAMAQDSGEKSSEATKALMSCKTVNEFAEAQNKLAQASFDEFMSGATKISEMSVKVATESFEPLNDQIGKNIKKASEAVAA